MGSLTVAGAGAGAAMAVAARRRAEIETRMVVVVLVMMIVMVLMIETGCFNLRSKGLIIQEQGSFEASEAKGMQCRELMRG